MNPQLVYATTQQRGAAPVGAVLRRWPSTSLRRRVRNHSAGAADGVAMFVQGRQSR